MGGRGSFTYDVYLSFRGEEDTRYGFTSHLFHALIERGINSFSHDKGDETTPSSFVNAIKQSKIAIVVLSKNYAFSSFCLKQLTAILGCFEEKDIKNGRLVFPVFYDVYPSDVRHCRGSYGEALAKHEQTFKDDIQEVKKWRSALQMAAQLSGFRFKTGYCYRHFSIIAFQFRITYTFDSIDISK